MNTCWFNGTYAERLHDELEALGNGGYSYRVRDQEKAEGRIVIDVDYSIAGSSHLITAVFPESYPYFPFELFCATFPPGRHKDPVSNSLCFLKSPLTSWSINDTLASILRSKISDVVKAHSTPEAAGDVEAHEATQRLGQLQYLDDSIVLTGDWTIPQARNYGYLTIGSEVNSNPNTAPRGAVLAVQDDKKTTIASIDPEIARYYSQKTFRGRWVRLASVPLSLESAVAEAIKVWKAVGAVDFQGGPDFLGLLVPEELEYGKHHENWLFIVRSKVHKSRFEAAYIAAGLVRSDRATRNALQARVPSLSPLASKKVLVCGTGSIGSAFAWQLARAGIGTLHLLDSDYLQLGNTPRWISGISTIGRKKVEALKSKLEAEYPYLVVKTSFHRIGGACNLGSEISLLDDALNGVDLIFDATAEWCISHYLSDVARQRKIDFAWATGTPGAWGGIAGRVACGKTVGCWKCFQRKLTEGVIQLPSQEQQPEIQPVGCFHPTFTGSGFDMDLITLTAVRLAVSTLCRGIDGAYKDVDWDVGVVDNFDENGIPIPCRTTTYTLDRHVECDCTSA